VAPGVDLHVGSRCCRTEQPAIRGDHEVVPLMVPLADDDVDDCHAKYVDDVVLRAQERAQLVAQSSVLHPMK